MISKHGARLLAARSRDRAAAQLLPRAFLLTPNLHEAEALTGLSIRAKEDMQAAAERLFDFGCPNVLIKGGHLPGSRLTCSTASDGAHFFEGRASRPVTPTAPAAPIRRRSRLVWRWAIFNGSGGASQGLRSARDRNHPGLRRRQRAAKLQYFGTVGSTLSLQARMPPFMFRTFLKPVCFRKSTAFWLRRAPLAVRHDVGSGIQFAQPLRQFAERNQLRARNVAI